MFTGYGCSRLLVDGVLKRAASAALAEARATSGDDGPVVVQHGQQGGSVAGGAALASSHEQLIARLASESNVHLHRLVAHFVWAPRLQPSTSRLHTEEVPSP